MPTYRPVPGERRVDYGEILQHAFAIEDGPDEAEGKTGQDESEDGQNESDGWPPDLYDPRGLFSGTRLVSVCMLYYPDVNLFGEFTTIGGLGGVATPPEHRREGHVRTLLRHALEEYRENGVQIVALWPFSTPFYRGLGWGTAHKYTRYEIPPEQLTFARDSRASDGNVRGEIRRLRPDDWERLRPVESESGANVSLAMRRSREWWRERTLADWGGSEQPYIYGYERDGELCGYVLYTVRKEESARVLRVTDIAYVDGGAYFSLLAFLSNHDSQVKTIELRRPEGSYLLDYVPDPETVDCAIESGPMVRLTDVTTALEQFPWPGGFDIEFTLGVTDPLLDRNDGLFEVNVSDGRATVSEDRGGADATVDTATLSQLYVGTYDVEGAERFGSLAVEDTSIRRSLSEAFRSRRVYLQEFF